MMNNRILIIVLALFMAIPFYGQNNPVKKVAILETVDKENNVSYGVKLMIRSKLCESITASSGYEGFDRVDIGSILNEHEFQRSGLVNDNDIKRLGEMVGADYVLIAEVAQLDPNHVIIVAKILNVETAKLYKTSNIQTATDVNSINEACQELASNLVGQSRGKKINLN